MSGHSKWATTKHKKAILDSRRAKSFAKLIKNIEVAARMGGPDLAGNPGLELAVTKAKKTSVPNDNIDRAIKRAVGGGEGTDLVEVTYEGFGPAGTALLIEVTTDNKNRAVAEVRNVFTRAGGNLGEAGSVAWMFDSRGVINLSANGRDADELALVAIDAGAEDVQVSDGAIEVYTAPPDLEKVKKALEDHGLPVESAETARVPKTTVQLDERAAIQALRLVEKLEGLDDVQKVYFNAEFSDDVLASYTS
jgi:YebC/PmpR family DNA-binding regulatory protein